MASPCEHSNMKLWVPQQAKYFLNSEKPFISQGLWCEQLLDDLCVIEIYLQKKNS